MALMLTGMVLLLAVSWPTFVIYLGSILTSYFGLRWVLARPAQRSLWGLALLAPLLLVPLLWFKYGNFLLNDVAGLGVTAAAGLVIPAGISFYSFQVVGFVVDTIRHRQPLPSLVNFLNFTGFFPQVVAGPIERREDLLPQMERFRFRWNPADIDEGSRWVLLGLFFKSVMADNFAALMPRGVSGSAYAIWLSNLLFGLRIYFDFAGYSLTALGLARCLGVSLILNFASPYCATSIGEFWRRWHISLSQWFRDYVYIPLGGGRSRWWAGIILVVFLTSGAWHGAGWSFILWGGFHAGFMIVHRLGRHLTIPGWVGWALTMGCVFLAWLPFYEVQPRVMLAKLGRLVTPAAYAPAQLQALRSSLDGREQLMVAFFLLLAATIIVAEWRSLRTGQPYRLLLRGWILAGMAIAIAWFTPTTANSFIYFAF
jgi:D-alanyl-lipoteichoic acid acyltransferase DltB (MBOAT superfamily)